MLSFRGNGAKETSKRILVDLNSLIAFPSLNGSVQHVRVVQQYRHMGSWLDARRSLRKELQLRRGDARTALKHLRRKVYCDDKIDQVLRWTFADALCVSRLLTNAHTISYSTKAERGSLHAAFMSIARTVSHKVTTPSQKAHFFRSECPGLSRCFSR